MKTCFFGVCFQLFCINLESKLEHWAKTMIASYEFRPKELESSLIKFLMKKEQMYFVGEKGGSIKVEEDIGLVTNKAVHIVV